MHHPARLFDAETLATPLALLIKLSPAEDSLRVASEPPRAPKAIINQRKFALDVAFVGLTLDDGIGRSFNHRRVLSNGIHLKRLRRESVAKHSVGGHDNGRKEGV